MSTAESWHLRPENVYASEPFRSRIKKTSHFRFTPVPYPHAHPNALECPHESLL